MNDNSSKLKNGMLLYHGSYAKVEKIDLGMCANAKDFGKGFYLTSDVKQARSFIKSSIIKAQNSGEASLDQNYGYVSSFRYYEPKDGILTYEFLESNKEWLWFIAQNRRSRLAKQLAPKIDPEVFKAEIIIGKVANDKTNATIMTYLGGLLGEVDTEQAVNTAINMLMPNKLEDQFCFLTEASISCLKFQEARRYDI